MWSGPRNISTALMRSFENRTDTSVIDEPFYAYYLKKTKLKHPMYTKIIKNYETNKNKIIRNLSNDSNNIKFIKHMTHHIDINDDLKWLKNTKNFFLIREPIKVINSYIKKNKLVSIYDLGYIEQLKIFDYLNSTSNRKPIVVNATYLLKNPKKILTKLCHNLDLKFENFMLEWPKGKRSSDGIWSKVWYKNVIESSKFEKEKKEEINIPKKYNSIINESFEIFSKLDNHSIK